MLYALNMAITDQGKILRLDYDQFKYGDIVRLTRAVPSSGGKRFKFVGAVFDAENPDTPLYFDLIEIKRGTSRAIRPEHVIKDAQLSKAAQARIEKKLAAGEDPYPKMGQRKRARCSWDHVTPSNPTGQKCGKPAKVEVNGPDGYFVCGIHARAARSIGDTDQRPLDDD